jgi:integrase
MRRYPSAKDLAGIAKPGRYAVGHGAYLQIAVGGTRSWLLRYRVGEKQFCMGLGSAEYVTLKEALHKAWEQQRLRLSGVDPLTERRRLRVAMRPKTAVPTFKDAATRYIAGQEPKWRGGASPREWRGSLENHVFPTLGAVRVDQIETQHVLSVLAPIWQEAPTTARRVRTRIATVLTYAKAHGWRDGDNPATLDIVKHLLPAQNGDKKNHAAIPYRELPEIVRRLRDDKTVVAQALLFVMLTACRASEAGGARWSEIEDDTWVIPAHRTKRGESIVSR